MVIDDDEPPNARIPEIAGSKPRAFNAFRYGKAKYGTTRNAEDAFGTSGGWKRPVPHPFECRSRIVKGMFGDGNVNGRMYTAIRKMFDASDDQAETHESTQGETGAALMVFKKDCCASCNAGVD